MILLHSASPIYHVVPYSYSTNFPLLRKRSASITCLGIRADEIIADFAHNKVLVAAGIAAAVGQLSKPFTSAIKGKGFDLKAAIRAGGMPSTHSAGVVAAATSLGLERGFSDSIFGMTTVFAVLVMYDAQGVRREVGKHAKILNKILSAELRENDEMEDSEPQSSSLNSAEGSSLFYVPDKGKNYKAEPELYSYQTSSVTSRKLDVERRNGTTKEGLQKKRFYHTPLNESVGHTELQVLVGALLGFIVAVAIDSEL